eukprot:scaffold5718_cov112-Skeletonema_dohrnii-CCMP3373.AAC.5
MAMAGGLRNGIILFRVRDPGFPPAFQSFRGDSPNVLGRDASDSLRPADPIASERQANGVGGGFVLTLLFKTFTLALLRCNVVALWRSSAV